MGIITCKSNIYMIVRSQLNTIVERMREPRKCIQVLAGPRQVGKTTLIKQFVSQSTIPVTSLNADEVASSNRTWLSDKWQAVRMRMKLEGQHEHILIVDEVDAFEADLDVLQEMEQSNLSVARLEEDVDCDENGVVKDDDYKALQTLSELLGVNVILR